MATISARRSKQGKTRYLAQIRLRGFPPENATFDKRTDAKQWAASTESAMREGRYFPTREAKRRMLAELIDAYCAEQLPQLAESEFRTRSRQLSWWKKRLGCYALADVTPARLADCLKLLSKGEGLSGKPASAATRNRYHAALSAAFRWAIAPERGWTDSNPARRISRLVEPDGKVRFLSEEEFPRLLAAARADSDRRMLVLILLAIATGSRESELMRLQWSDVRLVTGEVHFGKTKNGDSKTSPVRGRALTVLKKWARQQVRTVGCDYLFGRRGLTHSQAPPHFPRKRWESIRDAAGLADFRFHDLRHTTGSYLAMSGASEREIMEVLGHRTAVMARRYSHLSPRHVESVVERMVDKFM